ncbi:unnamed protein product [Cylicocyclus nassatus]|uniref:Uncharacterized protein n=1 Tax=Cylicocyclus nassatus TaxID=53992 RepID=A0AA36H7U2_CYLNA|nr:unnamed protein product [Cylicocyclus nassatus]
MSSIDVAGAVRNMLFGDSNISSELSLAMASLASAVDRLKNQQNRLKEQHDATTKELDLVRRMSRTNWLLVVNLPRPFGVSKGQALQLLFDNLSYAKPLFDAERDLLAAEILCVNRNGASCNMAFFVAQRHYDHIMGAEFQKTLVASKQKVPRGTLILLTMGK